MTHLCGKAPYDLIKKVYILICLNLKILLKFTVKQRAYLNNKVKKKNYQVSVKKKLNLFKYYIIYTQKDFKIFSFKTGNK